MTLREKQEIIGDITPIYETPAQFGYSIAINGNIIVAGSPFEDDKGDGDPEVGAVYFFEKEEDGTWRQTKVDAETLSNSNLGYSVSIDDNFMSVALPGALADAGRVQGWVNVGGLWTQLGTIDSSDPQNGQRFGESVGSYLDETDSNYYVAGGAPFRDSNVGGVWISAIDTTAYTDSLEDNFWADGLIVLDDRAEGDYFGTSIAMDNGFLVVGASGRDSGAGEVYIYQKDQNGTRFWGLYDILQASDKEDNDHFGNAVAISGDYLIVGAKDKTSVDDEVSAGAAYIFKYVSGIGWGEVKKIIISVGGESKTGSLFGASVDIDGDYAVIGAPGNENGRGKVDVAYRGRDWRTIKTLIDNNASNLDNFGQSVSISGLDIAVGSSGASGNSGFEGSGKVVIFEEIISRLRMFQEFDVDNSFIPTKASVYLRRNGQNIQDYWALSTSVSTVLDASNFLSIVQSNNKITFDDRLSGFTGNGYMVLSSDNDITLITDSDDDFSIIEYPIKATTSAEYNFWIRCAVIDIFTEIVNPSFVDNQGMTDNPSGLLGEFTADILFDGVVIGQLHNFIGINSWSWLKFSILLPDNAEHVLGIKMKEKNGAIDKMYIDYGQTVPVAGGPSFSTAPFLTVHMQLYEGFGRDFPVYPMYVYDYKNSIEEVIQDDWYNFNLNILDSRTWHGEVQEFENNLFLVLSVSGSSPDNFITWELNNSDNEEYISQSSGVRI